MEPLRFRRSDANANRWFSTGFMVGGVGAVDADKHTLRDAVMIRPGEAIGHGVWIDDVFCADIAARCAAATDKGLKARFGHPNMCSEALGTFLGRWKGGKLDADHRVLADLHLSSTAAESPKGDLRHYVEELAAKEPGHFGASIVFTMDWAAMEDFEDQHQTDMEERDAEGKVTRTWKEFRSPDPRNVQNLPHARCAELHAADLVDDPAATDGMFSGAGGLSLAAQMTEWLDTHPGVLEALNSDPELLDIVTRYADQLKPFLARYTANLSKPPAASAEPDAEPQPVAPTPAEPDAELQSVVASLQALLNDARTENERLAGQIAGLTAERDGLNNRLAEQTAAADAMRAERDEAQRKLNAIIAGAPPVSSVPATETKRGSMWDDARKTKKDGK